jgi:hypothetical protein
VLCAIVPLFALTSIMEFAFFSWVAALFHLAFGVTLSLLLMETMFLGFRKIPFTCAYLPGRINLVFLTVIYVFGFTMYSRTMAALEGWLGGEPLAAAAFFAVAIAGYLVLARWRGRELEGEPVLDYEDAGDPEVRTLELTA